MLSKQNEKDRPAIASFIIRQLLSAVNFMHERGFCHRDLKLENVLVSSISGKFVDTRLIDFGESEDLRPTEKGITKHWDCKDPDWGSLRQMTEFKGTITYMAPEIVNAHILEKSKHKNDEVKAHYNQLCDVWSIGIIAYVLLVGQLPYDDKKISDALK